MCKNKTILLLLLSILCPNPCLGQAMAEYGGTQASMVGLGAGLATSLNHGKAVRNSYEAMAKVQESTVTQAKAIEQYTKLGCNLEAKKKWDQAEESFKYVLKIIARKDGPGSVKSLPTLEHLVTVTKAQDKIDDAIGFQKTVVAFRKASSAPDTNALVTAQTNLAGLFVQKDNYASAEPILRDSVSTCSSSTIISPQIRRQAVVSYAKVLRKLNKKDEAEALAQKNPEDFIEAKIEVNASENNQMLKKMKP
jgi:tetratricopeptide (TPR) repeat protein